MDELSREDVRALAGEVLEALGVETVELDEGEQEVIRKAVEEWRRRRAQKKDEGI